ncbi:T9SS type A sorting domain-containing protein, partial [candidate division KSB1 bacterium]|nr:T9SS type A sorting domain-containing protein [candidate division KSB1 bacterium]
SSYPTWKVFDVYLPPSTSIEYKFIKKDGSGNVTWESGGNHSYTTPASGTGSVTNTWGTAKGNTDDPRENEIAALPEQFNLYQNYPNPFNPETFIAYDVPRGETVAVRLVIYNAMGQIVRTLVAAERGPGAYRVRWDGRNDLGESVTAGVYLYRFTAGDFASEKKLLILR